MSTFNETCVSLDIETTGLSNEKDQIIEIGIIKFEGDKIVDSFETLINPGIEVPYEVLSITGIKQSELNKAPKFTEIKDKIKKFVDSYPIVGHNIKFDLDFLKNNGLLIKNSRYDTWHLALILMPTLRVYSLESLTKLLKIEQTESHRALADAESSYKLFLFLVKLIYQISPDVRKEINMFLSKGKFDLGKVFKKIEFAKKNKVLTKEELKSQKPKISFKDFENFLKLNENKAINNFNLGPNEESLAISSVKILNNKESSFFESTARPEGFLLPAIYFSTFNQKKILIVSPNNRKDYLAKIIVEMENEISFNFNFVNIEDSYLCLRKFNNFKKQENFSENELKFLIKILLWLASNEEIHKISLGPDERQLWVRFSYEDSTCIEQNCPLFKACPVFLAKEKAKKSQIILLSQKSFFHDIFNPPSRKKLPVFRDFIITEAHLMEDWASESLTRSLDETKIENFFKNIENSLISYNRKPLEKELNDISQEIKDLYKKIDIFWGFWGMLWQEKNKNNKEIYMILSEKVCFGDSWYKILESTKSIIFKLNFLSGLLDSLSGKINNLELKMNGPMLEIDNYNSLLNQYISFLNGFILEKTDNRFIYWASFKDDCRRISLNKTPFEIKSYLRKYMFEFKDSAIFISAVTNKSRFLYLNEKLGLNNFKFLKTDKKLLREISTIYCFENLPEPDKEGYKKGLFSWLEKFIQKKKENSFILFNSNDLLKEAFKNFLPFLDRLKINYLSQSKSSVNRIINELKTNKDKKFLVFGNSNLLSELILNNFLLQNLVITKLPFRPLVYPIDIARAEELDNKFLNHILPQAITKLKEDLDNFKKISKGGSVYILDSRILNKDYGADFMQSISGYNLVYQK